MKNSGKKLFLTLTAMLVLAMGANAATGYADYPKIVEAYPLAQKYKKELDLKAESLKKYLDQKEEEIKRAATPTAQKAVRDSALAEVERRQKDYVTVKSAREKEIDTKIKAAAEQVRAAKKLDMILKSDAMVAGGVNCTQDIIDNLK